MLIERMAIGLGVPVRFIIGIANGASHEYKTYSIPKRTGGSRTIYHPSRRLKAIQRWLLASVIDKFPLHGAAMAYRKGLSTLDNAVVHASSSYLLRMDIHEFFSSIRRSDIEAYLASAPQLCSGWSEQDKDIFCRIVCRHGSLTVGAPTSPSLANALCYELDAALDTLSTRLGANYTRYADDLFFSTHEKNVLRGIADQVPGVLEALDVPTGLTVNVKKTRHSSKKGRRRVTGIVLGSDGNAHVGRAVKRRIRSQIYRYDILTNAERSTLAGLIAYAVGNDAEFMNSLISKYGLARIRAARLGV